MLPTFHIFEIQSFTCLSENVNTSVGPIYTLLLAVETLHTVLAGKHKTVVRDVSSSKTKLQKERFFKTGHSHGDKYSKSNRYLPFKHKTMDKCWDTYLLKQNTLNICWDTLSQNPWAFVSLGQLR